MAAGRRLRAAPSNRLAVGGRLLDLRTPGGVLRRRVPALHGAHQGENAAVALAAAEAFFGRPLDADLVAEAFAAVRNPGRFEVVQRDPLLILDGAHNPDGAQAVAETLAEGFVVTGELRLVVGVLDGRDPVELLEILDAAGGGRGRLLHARLAASAAGRGARRAGRAPSADARGWSPTSASALEAALAAADADDVVLVTGSLYTVGAARAACRRLGLV